MHKISESVMTHKTERDFPEEFLEMLGYMLSQKEREKLRAVSTRWNEAIKRIPPTENVQVKSVSIQDNMISIETARVSQYYFRNGNWDCLLKKFCYSCFSLAKLLFLKNIFFFLTHCSENNCAEL